MSEISILRLPPEEWPAYKDIRLEALKTAPQAFGASFERALTITDEEWRQRLATASDGPISSLLFARNSDGSVVGIIGSGISEDGTNATVYAMFVTAPARGKGVASRLIGALMDEIDKCPEISSTTLTVNQSQIAAIALYEKFGFQKVEATRELMGDGIEYEAWGMSRSR